MDWLDFLFPMNYAIINFPVLKDKKLQDHFDLKYK